MENQRLVSLLSILFDRWVRFNSSASRWECKRCFNRYFDLIKIVLIHADPRLKLAPTFSVLPKSHCVVFSFPFRVDLYSVAFKFMSVYLEFLSIYTLLRSSHRKRSPFHKVLLSSSLFLSIWTFSKDLIWSSGLQTRDIWCVRSDDKTPASVTACGTQKMPVKKRGCNAQACIEK